MIILDTNVVSEPLKSAPEPRVLEWLDNQAAETLFISTITYAELRTGVLKMPDGKRKDEVAAKVKRALELFEGRILDFDVKAAEYLALIAARGDKLGRKAQAPDAYIAAIASAHGYAVATRNTQHFQYTGISVINPWD